MYKSELNIGGRVFKVNWTEVDKQTTRSPGVVRSKILRILSVARSSAFLERIRIYSVVSTVMKWDITGAVLAMQDMQSSLKKSFRL